MAYRVDLARNAEAELEELYPWVVERAPQQGATWFNGLERAILTLDQHPDRCPVAPESVDPNHPVRVLSYGRKPHGYRVFFIFTVDTAPASCAWCI
jgi:toxin ParE1/3/4